MKRQEESFVICGLSRFPKEFSPFESLLICAEVDPHDDKVLDIACTPCNVITERLLKQIAVGKNLTQEVRGMMEAVDRRLSYLGKKAVLTALKNVHRDYVLMKTEGGKSE